MKEKANQDWMKYKKAQQDLDKARDGWQKANRDLEKAKQDYWKAYQDWMKHIKTPSKLEEQP